MSSLEGLKVAILITDGFEQVEITGSYRDCVGRARNGDLRCLAGVGIDE